MRKRTKKIVAAVFCIPLLVVAVVQPSITRATALNAKKAAQTQYYEKMARGNVFHTPSYVGDIVWTPIFNRRDMIHRVSLGYTQLPHSKTEAEFKELKDFAMKFIGVRYTPGGKSPATGFDCSGFVMYVFKSCGSQNVPGGSVEQYNVCKVLPSGYERPGDLVFFKGTGGNEDAIASHVGIYLGDGQMIHAGNTGIAIADLDNEYWPKHFMCFARPIEW